MLRMNQKIAWTRSELRAFEIYENLEMAACEMADPYMGGVTVGSSVHKQLEEIGEEVCKARDALKELMGTTRFNMLMNSTPTLKAWRGEISARYIAKYPWMAPDDCCPGWE